MNKWKIVFAHLNDDFSVAFKEVTIFSLTKKTAREFARSTQCKYWGIWDVVPA